MTNTVLLLAKSNSLAHRGLPLPFEIFFPLYIYTFKWTGTIKKLIINLIYHACFNLKNEDEFSVFIHYILVTSIIPFSLILKLILYLKTLEHLFLWFVYWESLSFIFSTVFPIVSSVGLYFRYWHHFSFQILFLMPFISILTAIAHFCLLVWLYYFFSNFIVPTFYWFFFV